MTEVRRHVGWLDGWRGAAVACVLVDHFGGAHFLGHFGVGAFFALSGLLISVVLYEKKQPLPEFFWRRAARILPGLWFFLLVIHGVDCAIGFVVSPDELLAELLFIRNYWPVQFSPWIDGTLPLAHLWSLNVEEQAYVAMALVAWLFRSRPLVASICLIGGSMVCIGFELFYRYHPPTRILPFTTRTEIAAVGIFMSAGLSRLIALRQWRSPRWLGPAALLLTTVLATADASKMSLYLVVVPIGLAVSINALAVDVQGEASWLHRALSMRWLERLGKVSFSVYIWQQPLHTLYRLGKIPGPGAVWLFVSVAGGVVAYILVERPCRSWLVARMPGARRVAAVQR